MLPITPEQLRAQFPALQPRNGQAPLIYFDGPGGTQMAQSALDAMVDYIRGGMANLHGTFPSSVATDALLDEARQAVADWLGCQPQEVAFGANMTTLAFAIARSLAAALQPGDEVLVTELDHRANVDPWLTLARDRGATVRFIPIDTATYTLDLTQLEQLITPRTRLVAVGLSSNVTGTVTPVEAIIRRARAVGALTVLDAVHAAPHLPLDFRALGCDVLLCSAYKFFGPHVGVAVVATARFEQLAVYKLDPAPADMPHKLETGTQNHEGLAGLLGALAFIQGLGHGSTRAEQLRTGIEAIDAYEQALAEDLEDFLRSLPQVRLYRAPAGTRKTPTLAFIIEEHHSREVAAWFAEHHRMCIADGHFYATTLADKLGMAATGGWVRIGLAPYNTAGEVEQFKKALREFLALHP
ncbi:cysteine desulfurase-like protein [Hymenobacter sp. CRA2]|uniref:cysteine desulfurase-like protein n=1 Tax=Hymenobacter sp. CRA2 TaxID=1955620 RepID=UPI0009901705|nr:cysteine desulfurase-like protein [Hymenobacter sp. CRA2]OON67712.1 cysteine desulfurase-like protein [Hymenobacter sp. CRA2]